METSNNLEERKRIWTALSAIYLDGELNKSEIAEIARAIRNSPFTLQEVMDIDKYEVYPALRNLFLKTDNTQASGANNLWLEQKIVARKEDSKLAKWWLEVSYVFYCKLYQRHWKRIKSALKATQETADR